MDERARETLATQILELARGGDTEAIVFDEDSGLTRFTQNAIHQNLAHRETSVRVRASSDGRTGVAATNDLREQGLRAVVARAREIATLAPRDETAAGLAANAAVAAPAGAYVEATAPATPALRAGIASDIIATAADGLWAAGYVMTARSGITIANSSGTLVSFDGSECALNVKQNAGDSSGYAETYGNDVALLAGGAAGSVAAAKARQSAAPAAVPPGLWTVILEPAAFGELLSYLRDHFSARAFDEGSSFLCDGLDRRYAGADFTLTDDYSHPLHAGMPFDFEGYPKRVVPLFEGGIARNVVTDASWAKRLARANTGHSLPAPSAAGPQVQHLVVSAGAKTLEQLIAETERGLLISRFWYIRPVDQRKTIVTGMTRDGTFLIENGVVGRGVRNMRFNQNILEALAGAEFADRQARTSGYAYSIVVPSVKFASFTFSSATEF